MLRAAAAVCAVIAVADLLQPLVLPWAPKLVGAVLGGLFYAVMAAGLARGVRPLARGVVLLPIVPVSVLLLTAAGAPLPVQPDSAMIGILLLQLTAALLAGLGLRQRTT